MARQMVCIYGMSESVGLVHCVQRDSMSMLGGGHGMHTDCSERTEEAIDTEVKKLLDDAYQEAKQILGEHREQLERVAKELLQRESIDAKTFRSLLDSPAEALCGKPNAGDYRHYSASIVLGWHATCSIRVRQ